MFIVSWAMYHSKTPYFYQVYNSKSFNCYEDSTGIYPGDLSIRKYQVPGTVWGAWGRSKSKRSQLHHGWAHNCDEQAAGRLHRARPVPPRPASDRRRWRAVRGQVLRARERRRVSESDRFRTFFCLVLHVYVYWPAPHLRTSSASAAASFVLSGEKRGNGQQTTFLTIIIHISSLHARVHLAYTHV